MFVSGMCGQIGVNRQVKMIAANDIDGFDTGRNRMRWKYVLPEESQDALAYLMRHHDFDSNL